MQTPSALAGVYAITDPYLLPGDQLFSGVEAALRGGVRLIQYRHKRAPERQQLEEASALKSLCHRYAAKLIINDNLTLCQAVDADGLHLGRSDGALADARQKLGHGKIIGATCHDNLVYAKTCYEQGADYCAFGRIFSSSTKPDAPPCSQHILETACKNPYPVVAIGGIDLENAPSLIEKGVDMIALIHGLFGQDNIEGAARDLCALFDHTERPHSRLTRSHQ
ncbi:MAG: thiamine phosphate synthase [Oleiphilus sp.]|nr:MAG: thiamine phosphate synthase [Oleiphilus sp.]